MKAAVFGVEYVPARLPAGGDLYLTRWGWPWLEHLLPERWYDGQRFAREGTRLAFSTGTVYRVPIEFGGRKLQIVAKFSRVGQHLEQPVPREALPGQRHFDPKFSSPFEEFAHLERLRTSTRGPRVLTKRALCVFSPAECYEDWELGRLSYRMQWHARRVRDDQEQNGREQRIELDPRRDYIVLFAWVVGPNLEELVQRGRLSHERMGAISRGVVADLRANGLDVLDHKPNHVIVRTRPDGTLVERGGRLVYALADFELLVPTNPDDDPDP